MSYDDFDYLDGSLTEWIGEFVSNYEESGAVVDFIENEYLPRFEAAVHKQAASKKRISDYNGAGY